MALLHLIQTIANPFWDKLFITITMLGEEYVFLVTACLILWCLNKEFGYRFSFAYLFGGIISLTGKEAFRIPRPIGQPGIRSLRLETAGGYSFPSGHAQFAASFWVALLLQIRRRWFSVLGIILILLVSFSRLYLGVHYLADVIAGMILGTVWVLVTNGLFHWMTVQNRKWPSLLFLIPAAIGLLFFPSGDLYKTAGAALGFLTGFWLEPRFINYRVEAKLWRQVVKMCLGIGILVLLNALLKRFFPALPGFDLLRYYIVGIWVTVGAPFLFKMFFRERVTVDTGVNASV